MALLLTTPTEAVLVSVLTGYQGGLARMGKPPKFDELVKGASSIGSNWNKIKDGVSTTEPQKKRRRAMVRHISMHESSGGTMAS